MNNRWLPTPELTGSENTEPKSGRTPIEPLFDTMVEQLQWLRSLPRQADFLDKKGYSTPIIVARVPSSQKYFGPKKGYGTHEKHKDILAKKGTVPQHRSTRIWAKKKVRYPYIVALVKKKKRTAKHKNTIRNISAQKRYSTAIS